VLGGSETQTIVTNNGETAGAWRGIAIDGGTGHELEYTLIERGGSSGSADVAANLHIFGGASVYLNRIDLVDGEGHGLSVHTDSTLVTCTGLIFEGNAGEALHSYGGGAAPACP
jgi:hypothetical protein